MLVSEIRSTPRKSTYMYMNKFTLPSIKLSLVLNENRKALSRIFILYNATLTCKTGPKLHVIWFPPSFIPDCFCNNVHSQNSNKCSCIIYPAVRHDTVSIASKRQSRKSYFFTKIGVCDYYSRWLKS